MKFIFLATVFLSVQSVQAQATEINNCSLSEVINEGYEELYGFSFAKNPKLILKKDEANKFAMIIGALSYSEATDKYFEIMVYNNPNKYFVFYDGLLTETIEFVKNIDGKTNARLRAILDESDELYDIARFNCN